MRHDGLKVSLRGEVCGAADDVHGIRADEAEQAPAQHRSGRLVFEPERLAPGGITPHDERRGEQHERAEE